MQNLKEDMFGQMFQAGYIRSVCLEVRDGHAAITYQLAEGGNGTIHTKRGEVKQYRVETALRFLWCIGMDSVKVDMKGWSRDGQQSLV